MARLRDYERFRKAVATEEPPREEEARQMIEEYIADLREVLKKLRRSYS